MYLEQDLKKNRAVHLFCVFYLKNVQNEFIYSSCLWKFARVLYEYVTNLYWNFEVTTESAYIDVAPLSINSIFTQVAKTQTTHT